MASLFTAADPAVAYALVAVERGVDRYPDGLTYAIPASLADLSPGERVRVPLGRGNQAVPGYVVERRPEPAEDVDPERIKPILARDPLSMPLPGQLIGLARWISGYYCAPIGMTLATMLPAAVKRGVGMVRRTVVDLVEEPPESKVTPAQQKVLEAIAGAPRPIEIRRLADLAGVKTTGPIKRLIEAGRLTARGRTTVEAAWSEHATDADAPERLTADQRSAIDAIGDRLGHGFSVHLVHGVTGSGKTEVYIRLIEQVMAADRAALVLVPEISLTPQTAGRLLGRFPERQVAILHSGLTAAQRHQQWALAAEGGADIVIGARSAVFAPVPDGRLGLIVVDEEHDGSYKQDQVPRYQGRDVAIRRAQDAGVPIVLGSATPSLESWYNATERRVYRLHRLPHRAPGLRLPKVTVVDFAEQRRQRRDRRVHLMGPVLEGAVGQTLDAGGQILILLNRRGYANYICCPDQRCGWLMTCPDCDVSMVYHLARDLPTGGYVRCHHCLGEQLLPETCPDCGKRVNTFGFGTQRVENELSDKFPVLVMGRTMLRLDSDTMRSAADYHDALSRFGAGSVRVLVGTQMIAKGLDYPGVRLVGVINADTSINMPDFRAAERTFQLVSQVAGRCGRGDAAGRVVVQTFNPEAPPVALAAAHDFETFAAGELVARRRCDLPPITRMARIVVRDEQLGRAAARARDLAEALRPLLPEGVRLRGPARCPIGRIAGRHRQQIELTAPTAATLQRCLAAARTAGLLHAGADLAIDVDPVQML